MRPSLPRRWRPEWLVAAVVALLLAGTGAVVAGSETPTAPSETDRGCTRAFPVRLTPRGEGLYDAAIARLVVCEDASGTATLLHNATAAVWVVEAPLRVTVHRERSSTIDRSFLELVRWPVPVVLPGARVAVPAPASALEVRVEPRLTIAALAHERLATSLLATAPPGSRAPALVNGADALAECVGELLDALPVPAAVLSGGNPGREIADAAVGMASAPDSRCVRMWVAAKMGTSAPAVRITPLAQEVSFWSRDPTFVFRALDAAITYSALGERLFP